VPVTGDMAAQPAPSYQTPTRTPFAQPVGNAQTQQYHQSDLQALASAATYQNGPYPGSVYVDSATQHEDTDVMGQEATGDEPTANPLIDPNLDSGGGNGQVETEEVGNGHRPLLDGIEQHTQMVDGVDQEGLEHIAKALQAADEKAHAPP
jgi:hypothetical protein